MYNMLYTIKSDRRLMEIYLDYDQWVAIIMLPVGLIIILIFIIISNMI